MTVNGTEWPFTTTSQTTAGLGPTDSLQVTTQLQHQLEQPLPPVSVTNWRPTWDLLDEDFSESGRDHVELARGGEKVMRNRCFDEHVEAGSSEAVGVGDRLVRFSELHIR